MSQSTLRALRAGLLLLTLCSGRATWAAGPAVPVGLAWGRDGLLRVVLRDARAVVVVRPSDWSIQGRHALPFAPASIRPGEAGDCWIGGTAGEVAQLDSKGTLRSIRSATNRGATQLVPVGSGRVAVASRWDDHLRILETSTGREIRAIPLGRAPGSIATLPDASVLFVADAFGSALSRVDLGTGSTATVIADGVALRGLRVGKSGGELLFVGLTQYQSVPATAANIDWGLVLSSGLHSVPLAAFRKDASEADSMRLRLGLDGSKHGAADPSALVESPDGHSLYMAVTGVDQVLRTRRTRSPRGEFAGLGEFEELTTARVGRQPVDLAIDPSGEFLVTADSGSDTLTVFRAETMAVERVLRLGPEDPVRSPAQRGERIFRDGRRSMDGWFSCASCHVDGHTNGLNFDTLGDGDYGASKNTPSLLALAGTPPFGWTGRFEALSEQAHQSFVNSMKGPTPDPTTVTDLLAYLGTLTPPPPRRSSEDPLAGEGAALFRSRGCITCHRPPSYTVGGLREVTLEGREPTEVILNPPSLLGVGWSAPYLHDGSAETLDDVLQRHHPGASSPFPSSERQALRAFLESL